MREQTEIRELLWETEIAAGLKAENTCIPQSPFLPKRSHIQALTRTSVA